MATLDEEQKNAVRKLTAEKNALAEENDSLRKKILDLTDPEEKPLTAVDQVTCRRTARSSSFHFQFAETIRRENRTFER